MALDYVKSLRDMEGASGEALQPRVKITPEQAAAQEAQAREIDRENGRFGRFRDQAGNWATAWQAPGRRTPIVPPRFVEPSGRIRRLPTGELTIEGAEGSPVMIPAQSWVVRYDGEDNAIVADDDAFRGVMVREDKIHAEPEEAEADAAPDYPYKGDGNTAGPMTGPSNTSIPQANNSTSLSVDGFVAQVLSDNQRLRIDLEAARRWGNDAHADTAKAREAVDNLHRHNEKLAGRLHWLWYHVTKAMGAKPEQFEDNVLGDRDVEYWLADAGKSMQAEEVDRLADLIRGNGQDPPLQERPAVDAAAEADPGGGRPPEDNAPKPSPSLNRPRRSPLKVPDETA